MWGGRYAVFDELASGGMASVFLACRLVAGESARVVAIKKMFESFAKRPELVTMFLDEAHIAARIRHPNVVTTYEFIRVPDSLAIVMEFVLGASLVDLQDIMADRGAVAPLPVTAAIVHNVLEGLHAAHEAKDEHGAPFGLVHRDVSPHNVLIGKDGLARVIDFGIAKAAGRLQVTGAGVMKGKLAYMAPEQIRAETVDRRVDIYSVGVVLWESLTGEALFQGDGEIEQLALRRASKIKVLPPSMVKPKLSTKLDAVVLRALAVNKNDRFATAHDMAEALAAATALGSQADVATWVTGLAGSKIRELEAMRNEVEAAFASGELATLSGAPPTSAQSPPAQPSPPAAVAPSPPAVAQSNPPAGAAPSSADFEVPDLVPQPRMSKPVLSAPPSKRQALAPIASSYDDAFDASAPSDLRLDVEMPRSSRTSFPSLDPQSPSVAARDSYVPSRISQSSRSRRSGRGPGWLVSLVLIAAVGVVAFRFGPEYVKSSVIAAAARRGLVLTVDHIEPRSGGVALAGASVSLEGVNDVSVKAPEIEVALDWQGTVQKISIPGYELSLRGKVTDVAARLASWRKESHLPVAFEAKAGHLLWSDALALGVQIEGLDTSLAADVENAVHIEVPSLSVGLARGSFGPWRAVLDTTADETKLAVALDRSKLDGPPSISLVARPNLGMVVVVTIPRTKVSQVGIPAEFMHASGDPEIELVLEGQAPPVGDRLTSRGKLTLFAMPTPLPGAAPADVLMEGEMSGTPPQKLRIDPGTLTIGKVKAPLMGEVTFEAGGVRVEVDRPFGKGPLPPPFVLDTRDWTTRGEGRGKQDAAPAPTPAASASGRRR